MRRVAAGVVMSVIAIFILPFAGGAPTATAGLVGGYHHGSKITPGGTFMVGDSTTYRVAPRLRAIAPDWFLDYRRGRSIGELPARIKRYLAVDPNPTNFIMALGTNRTHNPEWSYDRLRKAIALLPDSTNVFLVLVVRTGEFQADKDAVLRLYNSYSRELAKKRPRTYLIDWRGTVLEDPTLNRRTGRSSLLEDGTHQSGGPYGRRAGPGVRTYADLVVSRWEQVNGRRVRTPVPVGESQEPALQK